MPGTTILTGPQRVNDLGDYALLANPNAAMVSLNARGRASLAAVSGRIWGCLPLRA